MADRWVPATPRFREDERQKFQAVRLAIAKHADELRAIPGVVGLRPGYRFKDGWITDEPAVVVTVDRKVSPSQVPAGQLIPRELEGVEVDVSQATPLEQLEAGMTSRGTRSIPSLPPEYQPALPDTDDDVTQEFDVATRAATQPYVPPPGLALDAVAGPMTVVCHASPDAGWTTLGPFLAATRHALTVGMFDFSAPHILKGLCEAIAVADGPLRLVLDPALTLGRSKDPSSPKANDVTEEVVREELERAAGTRSTIAWAAVKRAGKTTGGIFASAYHIKVAVRDGAAFWLSSGNWQSSNQPDPERLGPDADPDDLLRAYNREWHVIVEHPGLARVFEQYVEHDLAQAVPLQRAAADVLTDFPDVLVPADGLPRTRGIVELFPPKTFVFTAEDPIRVQPLLTPDNYAGHILELIRSARKSLFFQNQYISVARRNAGKFAELVDALREKVNDDAIDGRVILRDGGDARAMLESLKAQGFCTDRIRLQRTCHNKGIIVDGRVVALGSHNWSSDGTTANRDATLIFHSPEIARYYQAIFLFDWEHRSRHRVVADTPRGMPILARPGEAPPPGMVRLSWGDFIEEADEAARLATLAMATAGATPAPAVPRPFLPEASATMPANRPEVVMPGPQPSKNLHALLVAIDRYNPPVPKLRGCVNDIDAFASYLSERVKGPGVSLKLKTLRDGEATRQAVIDAFRVHLGQAGPGDVALFYYSGHGSQEQAPEEFWKLEPDHLDETLVLFDSRQPGSWDLADKEIAKLIDELAARGPHVAVILDCCHSGSGTREIGTVTRRAPTDLRRRPIESFLVTPNEAQAAAASATRGAAPGGVTRGFATEGRHVLFAACRDDEEAKECVGAGRHRGTFSFFLGEALRSATGVPTYRDLFARTSAGVSNMARNQSPQLEATRNEDLDATFLDGAILPAPSSFTARRQDGHWTINGGATSGIPAPAPDGSDAARLALYRFDAPPDELSDPARAVAMARVETVLPTTSRLIIEDYARLDPSSTYKAIIASLPTPRLCVLLEGDPPACDSVRAALKTASPEGGPSLFIREASEGESPEFRLVAREGQFVITRLNDERPLVGQIEGLDAGGAKRAVARLEHIARWTQTARLSNPASTIRPDDVTLTILVDGEAISGREVRLEYRLKDGKQVPPTFQVSMTNNSQRTLFCGLLDLTQRFQVDAGLLRAGHVKLEPGETAWGYSGNPIPASIPDEAWKQGVIEYKDLLKLIVSTEEFDARLLEQPALEMPRLRGVARGISRAGSLNRLMQRIQTRGFGEVDVESIDDWQATEVSFTTVRPLATTPIPGPGRDATLTGGVMLGGHPGLRARARLATAPLSTRDLGNVTLPRLFYDDPSVSQPWSLTASRGNEPGLSVLELTEVNDSSAVTPESPLRMTVPLALHGDEHVVPIAYDGEFFLPLGRVESRSADATVIVLDRLPPPLADTRSLGGAIKIFFQKVISKRVGLDFPYPLLGAADVAPDGAVTPIHDTSQVRDRVTRADRILLFVHGLIGDTQSMVPSVQLARSADGQPLASRYDLVLTFDYEDPNTTIEDNGRKLRARLEEVGLGAGHGKALEIAAHSTGGLLARWFIEREGGNQIARRLVMLGTPNGGWPWPRIVDWATVALALGLNHLTAIAWPAAVVGWLAARVEDPTVALDEMLSSSNVLAELKQSADPGIPYVMLAGNTSIIPAATGAPDAQESRPLARLLARLTSPELLHEVAYPSFFDQANDVAVSVASMENIAPGRKPPYEVRRVACDHLSYFRDPAGLQALLEVLSAPSNG